MYISPIFFGNIISRHGVRPNPRKMKVLMDMPLMKTKKELQAFLRINNYLNKFSPSTADICESLRKLTSARNDWTWNATYHKIFNKTKSIIR